MDPRPTADLAAFIEAASRYRAAEWRQRIEVDLPVTSPEHNANVEEWRAADAALAALLGESSPYRAISRPAVEWRIAKCPHCGEELSVAASRPTVGEEGLREAARNVFRCQRADDQDPRNGDLIPYSCQWHSALRAALAAADKPDAP